MNQTLQDILERKSCKNYKSDPVPQEILDQIIEAGLYAASGMNLQTGKILAVTDKEIRDRLSALNAKYDPRHRVDPFYNAPVVLSVFFDKGEPMGVYDGSLVMGNMMIAAQALGVGSCWIHRAKEVFNDPEGQAILKLAGFDGDYEGVGNLVVGYPETVRKDPLPRKEGRVGRL